MKGSITHFEIYGDDPSKLGEFYRSLFGWQIEQMTQVGYWRIEVASVIATPMQGGLTYRAIPGLNGWMLYVNVESMDETLKLLQTLGGSIIRPKTAVPKAAWVTIAADPANNIFGVWQADPTAFPLPEPD
jgi:predicted enzyme related to lactoylglutathione lyase